MFQIPRTTLAALNKTAPWKLEALLEHRLSVQDVAGLLGCSYQSVIAWSERGRRGLILKCRTHKGYEGRNKRRAYNLNDVRQFARLADIAIDYTTLHPALVAEWNLQAIVDLQKDLTPKENTP